MDCSEVDFGEFFFLVIVISGSKSYHGDDFVKIKLEAGDVCNINFINTSIKVGTSK